MVHNHKKQDQILYIGFNQRKSQVTVGTEKGFHIYQSDTMEAVGGRKMGGGLGIVEVLNTSNLMVLSGGGRYPLFPLCKIIIWDDDEERRKAEITFKSAVKAVKIKVEYQVVVLELKILVYNTIGSLELLYQAETLLNLKGVFSINSDESTSLLAFPAQQKKNYEIGKVAIVDLNQIDPALLEEKQKFLCFQSHSGALCCLEFNYDGKLLATASEKVEHIFFAFIKLNFRREH